MTTLLAFANLSKFTLGGTKDSKKIEQSKSSTSKRYFGCAKGELSYPDDIDFCNDEIAEMFGVDE